MNHLSLEQAQQKLLSVLPTLDIDKVPLSGAMHRVLGRDIAAPQSLPAGDQSAVDGFAVGSATSSASSSFKMVGHYHLGDLPIRPLQADEAAKVSTGGCLPPGTHAVVPHEKTSLNQDTLLVGEKVKPGQNIKRTGEDYCQGEVMVNANTWLDAGCIALLAAMGLDSIPVYRKPRAAILSLAANVVSGPVNITPGQTRDSNGPMLAALVQQQGGKVMAVEKAVSGEESSQLLKLLNEADIVICTGGSYMEDDSEARQLFQTIGAKQLYWDVAVQPGSHNGAASWQTRLLFALSGNPAACFVGYHLFVAPVLRAMLGQQDEGFRVVARCVNGFNKAANTRRLVRGRARRTKTGWEVTVLPGQKPSMLRSLLNCNALIDIPAGSPAVDVGANVEVLLL